MSLALALNVVYLARCRPGEPRNPSRFTALGRLWLDAKEHELKVRAGKE